MEFWPTLSSTLEKTVHKKTNEKGSSRETWSDYPVINHGGQSAATLVKVGQKLEWRTVHSTRKGSLTAHGKPSKIYPCTRPKGITNDGASLRQRSEQGARFLRTYHPDIDIPFELIKDELDYDDKLGNHRAIFDPFMGNALAATYCFEGVKRRAIALAFPAGNLSRDLNISPINLRQSSVVFQPRTQPLWSFDTPIFQITSSAPAVNMTEKKGYYLAVRTYGQVSVFDIRNQITSVTDSAKSPFTISELMSVRSNEYDSSLDGRVMDVSLSSSVPVDLFLVTERGAVYQCSRRSERRIIEKIFDKAPEGECAFWRIAGDQTTNGGTVASMKRVRKFDTRFRGISTDLLTYDDGPNVITSIHPTQTEHFFGVSTTSQVIWIDERFPKQPLLGWKHHRAFDRSLSLQTIEYENTSLALLSSSKNNHVSVVSVGKLHDGPLQCQMPSRALPPTTSGGPVTGRTVIRYPGTSSSSFSLLELSDQGSLHHQELCYATDASTVAPERENAESHFNYHWSDEVHELEKQSKDLQPDYGKLSSRELALVDLTDLYEALFGEQTQGARAEAEEAGAEGVYETLDKMPLFWQRSDLQEEHMRTLFDVVYGSGEEPLHEARAEFLTGSILNSSRGYRARKEGHIPIADVAERAGWHMNIQAILHKIAPGDFEEKPISLAAELDPYHVSREEELPEADRRESEAREQLALDLALSADVFSSTRIKDPRFQGLPTGAEDVGVESQEDTTLLTQAAEGLSLSDKEPPQVAFGFHRPVVKDGKKYYRNSEQGQGDRTVDVEEDEVTKMPLGVRLLLSDWNVGDDPYTYEYVDAYDLDSSAAESQLKKSQSQSLCRRQQRSLEDAGDGSPRSRTTQSQVPPRIIAAKPLAATQVKPVAEKVSLRTPTQRSVMRGQTQTQTQYQHGISQAETELASSQPIMMTNTQVLQGPFGGRQAAGIKKSAKPRLGGF